MNPFAWKKRRLSLAQYSPQAGVPADLEGTRSTGLNTTIRHSPPARVPSASTSHPTTSLGQSRARHREHTVVRQVPADEPARVAEECASDARDLLQVGITNTAPCLWQAQAVHKAVGALGNALDAPLAVRLLGVLGVEDVENLGGRLESRLNREEVVLPGRGLESAKVSNMAADGLCPARSLLRCAR